MSATDELRRMLDERGVEHEDIVDATLWKGVDGTAYTAAEVYTRGNTKPSTKKLVIRHMATPEQAVAATLGREPDEAAIAKLHDRMNVALLECKRTLGIEKADGTIVVPLVYEMHNLLEEAAALGSCSCTNSERTETCNADETETWECVCDQIGRYGKRVTIHVMECSECGHTYEHVNGDYEFCPHCGRRVVEVDA